MNPFDLGVLLFLNEFAQRSQTFDHLVVSVSDSNLFKGAVLVAMLWWAWFRTQRGKVDNRGVVLSTAVASLAALFIARILALTLPFRPRPIHNLELGFQLPYFITPTAFAGWSSFPSDHAVLFFTLATGLLFVSRPLGIFSILYTFFVICLPRIYLGLHYPTDIIGGALIGIGIAWLVNVPSFREAISRPFMRWLRRYPGSFYACFFLFSYQVAILFDDIRALIRIIFNLLKDVFT